MIRDFWKVLRCLPALYSLAKENNCSISIGIYPNNCVFLKVRIGSMKQLELGVTDSNCSEEKLLIICTDIIRTVKEKSDERNKSVQSSAIHE